MTKGRCQFWAKRRFLKVGSYLRKISKAEVRTRVLRARLNVRTFSGFGYINSHVILQVEVRPSIASSRERTRAKHVFMWRQTSEFQVWNFQVFPPNCEVLLLDTAQREDDSNRKERKKLSERRPTFNDLWNQVKGHVKTCFARVRSRVDAIDGNKLRKDRKNFHLADHAILHVSARVTSDHRIDSSQSATLYYHVVM